jgi:hypothetical protein
MIADARFSALALDTLELDIGSACKANLGKKNANPQ